MSPTSLAITFKQIQDGKNMSFYDVFSMEYRLGKILVGTDVTQTKITSYRIENFLSVGRTDLAVVILKTSELTLP